MNNGVTYRWYQQPLVHFVLGGLLIFILDSALYSDSDEKTIRVDEGVLLNYLQVSQKSFNLNMAKAKFEQMSEQERDDLERRYINDEVLYREAMNLGLDEHDYLIRTRLIQKMDYLILDTSPELKRYSEDGLSKWFSERIESYRIDPSISFTHVFFSTRNESVERARQRAATTLDELNSNKLGPDSAHKYGERFYFHRDYTDRTPEFVEGHFGEEFKNKAFMLNPGEWSQPMQSEYGFHLLYVMKNKASRLPELEEVADIVLADYERAQRFQIRQNAIDNLKQQYQVVR